MAGKHLDPPPVIHISDGNAFNVYYVKKQQSIYTRSIQAFQINAFRSNSLIRLWFKISPLATILLAFSLLLSSCLSLPFSSFFFPFFGRRKEFFSPLRKRRKAIYLHYYSICSVLSNTSRLFAIISIYLLLFNSALIFKCSTLTIQYSNISHLQHPASP